MTKQKRSRKNPMLYAVQVRMDKDLHKQVTVLAAANKTSAAEIIRRTLADHLTMRSA